MECISIFDMLKIGIGPSSSHTLGPWRAGLRWLEKLESKGHLGNIESIRIDLFGSLSLTGKGHATDVALIMGLCRYDPTTVAIEKVSEIVEEINTTKNLPLGGKYNLQFDPSFHIIFKRKFHPFHPNAMTFHATLSSGKMTRDSYFSIGGGFVVQKERKRKKRKVAIFHTFPYPIKHATELLKFCHEQNMSVAELVLQNELTLRSQEQIDREIAEVWDVMLESMYIGCHTEGNLPGGLNVRRRAFDSHERLMPNRDYSNKYEWISEIRKTEVKFRQILKWVSCLALAVNEVNASLGRVVTAPTNGSAGVIPAVMMYYMIIENHDADMEHVKRFMLVAGEIGSLFKKGSTISAALGGCQAEIGVSSAMAAGALTELMGGTPEQVLMASEIAMEHHLGLTCDPIAGLVQIPCIERNAMGAIKAINACEMALDTDAKNAKVPLDKVIATMWETAQDMHNKYKETSEGGLAVKVNVSDC